MTTSLKTLIKNANQITVFTGAGVSTECGIPDFRSPDGLWSRYTPIQYDDFMNSQKSRNEDWRRRFILLDEFNAAQPGSTHKAISQLMALNPNNRVITQNIDELHQRADIPNHQVIELHGTAAYALCQTCHERYENDEVRKTYDQNGGIAPDCVKCGGHIKIAVIHFGQPMPQEPMLKAQLACEEADLFIAAGSSLVVHPAADFPIYAKTKGAKLVIANREPTPLDEYADLVLNGDLSDHFNENLWA